MKTKFIEATNNVNGHDFNWGKFLVCQFDEKEWAYTSKIDEGKKLLKSIGFNTHQIWVLDLQTCEGAAFVHGGSASYDLNEKHKIWVCVLYEEFLKWLYQQDLTDIDKLPAIINLPTAEAGLAGYRRGKNL